MSLQTHLKLADAQKEDYACFRNEDGSRRVVRLLSGYENGGIILFFQSPLQHGDFENGVARPRAQAMRHKSQLLTGLAVTEDSAWALYGLLKEHFESSESEE